MSFEENKAIVRKVTEAENNRDLTVIDELISPTYFNQSNQIRGPEGYRQFLTKLFKAFPNWHETIEDIVAEGDKVWVRFTATGTHVGEWLGLAPTRKK
jgi:C-1 hydroxylase